jgi:hypothetical protein
MQDEEMRSLYGRLGLLEEWIWERLRKTPMSASQWENLQRDFDRLAEAPLVTPAQGTARATEAGCQQRELRRHGSSDQLGNPPSLAAALETPRPDAPATYVDRLRAILQSSGDMDRPRWSCAARNCVRTHFRHPASLTSCPFCGSPHMAASQDFPFE